MATYIKNKTTGNWERSGWNGVLSFGFTGCIVPFAGAAEKVPAHWLVCDGSEVGRNEYPDLFDCIGETYGAGDGSTTFNLPDFRECTLVGIGKNTTNVKDSTEGGNQNHDEYILGEFKDDQIQNITGYANPRQDADFRSWCNATDVTGAFGLSAPTSVKTTSTNARTINNQCPGIDFDASRVVRAGTVTRGKRKGVNYIIHI